jgi:hypothetical protein
MSLHAPTFSKLFSSVIWKIIADSDTGTVYVETRDGDKRKALFHAFDLQAKKMLWADVSILDAWWSSLKIANKGNLLVVKFNDPDMPEQRGFAVIDGKTSKLLWGSDDAQVMQAEPDGIIVAEGKEEDSSYLKLDWAAGKTLGAVSVKEMFSGFNKKAQTPSFVLYPFHFEEENSFFSKIKEYIEIITGHKAVRMIEYLEKGDKVLISYYIYEEEKLTNFILVADEKGALLVHEKLNAGLKGIGMDTFFVLKDQLIVVKNNNELQSYVIK